MMTNREHDEAYLGMYRAQKEISEYLRQKTALECVKELHSINSINDGEYETFLKRILYKCGYEEK